jgi:hypothetical protein
MALTGDAAGYSSRTDKANSGGEGVSGEGEAHVERDGVGVAQPATTYEAYASARRRFFAKLEADAQIRRLERVWRLPDAERGPIGSGDPRTA